jgi:hypothetical protein
VIRNVDFFTPISFGGRAKPLSSQSLLQAVDSYSHLDCINFRKAFVVPNHTRPDGSEEVILQKDFPTRLSTIMKVASYATLVTPAVMLILKGILRSFHTFYIIEPSSLQEEGIDIPEEEIQERLTPLINTILQHENVNSIVSEGIGSETITWYPAKADIHECTRVNLLTFNEQQLPRVKRLVFSLGSIPNLIFKLKRIDDGTDLSEQCRLSKQRFDNMVKARAVCIMNGLDLLAIPHAKKFSLSNGMILIAEERLKIDSDGNRQKEYYRYKGLEQTVRQLVRFIAKTGFSDVTWQNIPLLDTALEPPPEGRHVALVDLEEMVGGPRLEFLEIH